MRLSFPVSQDQFKVQRSTPGQHSTAVRRERDWVTEQRASVTPGTPLGDGDRWRRAGATPAPAAPCRRGVRVGQWQAMSRLRLATVVRSLGLLLLLGAGLLAACSDDDSADFEVDLQPTPLLTAAPSEAAAALAAFVDDPALVPFLLTDHPALPARFRAVPRTDREPILSLGLVSGAARATYSSVTTDEILSIDVLAVEADVDPEPFFAAFADALGDNPNFRGLRTIGVVRGIGDNARRYAFTIEGDEAAAAAIRRSRIIALVTYRRPPDLRDPVDLGALLQAIDAAIQAAPSASAAGSPAGG